MPLRNAARWKSWDRDRLLSVLALAAIPIILVLLGFLLAAEFEETRRLREEVDRSYATRLAAQRVLSLHQDIETGQRGFALTGDPMFLAPHIAAQQQIGQALNALEADAVTSGGLRADVVSLRSLSAAKTNFAQRVIALRRSGRVSEATALIATGRGKDVMDEMRRHISRIDSAEQQRLDTGARRADEARRRAMRLTFALLTALGLLLLAATWTSNKSMRAKRLALRRVEDLAARQEAIFSSAKDGIITLNASGSIESLNPAAAGLYGYQPEELVRRDVGILFEVAPDRDEIETFLKRLQGRRRGDLGRVQEFWARRRDGTTFPCDVAVSPVPLADGLRYVAIIRDVSERKQVEQMKSEFVSTVSHELRTPLTSIAGSLGLLAGGAAGNLPEKAARLIKIAHSNSERLVRLINDILDIEKIESGKMSFDSRPLPLEPLLEQAIQANRAFAEVHGVSLVLRPVPDDLAIVGDPDRMMQVFTNLLSNAAKFSESGGEVTVSVTQLDRRHRITVTDRGVGIPEEFQPRIFTKFAQADSTDTRQKGGTGLGLSIVKEIVERSGGSIDFESRIGVGTSFHVDLPAAEPAAPPETERQDVGELGEAGGPLILHVDDDPDMLRVVASAFEGRAQIHSTPSVQEARAAILRFDFDAVILDIGMADGSGLDLVPILRRQCHSTPIIVFSAQDADPSTSAIVDAVLTKSRASFDLLVQTVDHMLEREQRQAGAQS